MLELETTKPVKKGKADLLSARQVMQVLAINRATLYQWLQLNALKCQVYRIGNRTIYSFEPGYVDRIKKALPRGRGPGVHLMNEELLQKLKAIQ